MSFRMKKDVVLKRKLCKYLKKSGRLRTLEALLEDCPERKPAGLSFVIQKPPKRIKNENENPKNEKKPSRRTNLNIVKGFQ